MAASSLALLTHLPGHNISPTQFCAMIHTTWVTTWCILIMIAATDLAGRENLSSSDSFFTPRTGNFKCWFHHMPVCSDLKAGNSCPHVCELMYIRDKWDISRHEMRISMMVGLILY